MAFGVAEIACINLDDRSVTMTDGETLPITDFFDELGDDCAPANAVTCVAGRENYGWMTIEIFPDGKDCSVH